MKQSTSIPDRGRHSRPRGNVALPAALASQRAVRRLPEELPLAANAMPRIELRLRAYPGVHVGGQAVSLALKRGLALLALLTELGRKVARTRLSELLWPDAPSEVGRGRLRRLAHETNQAMGIDAIAGDADAVWLAGDVTTVVSDVERTRRLARQVVTAPAGLHSREALEELLQPDAHHVLDGFEFGSEHFDEWAAQRRSEQHRLVARALQRAGEQLVDSGQPLLAAEAAARLVAIEPLADAGHSLLLRAHAESGDLAALESAYLAFAELLRRELGVRPSPAYEALYEAARRRVTRTVVNSRVRPAPAVDTPSIRFADTDDGAITFLEIGDGPRTMFVVFGIWSHIEIARDEPSIRSIHVPGARLKLLPGDDHDLWALDACAIIAELERFVDDLHR